MDSLHRVWTGLKRHPYRFVVEGSLAFSALWTGLDALDNAFPQLVLDRPIELVGLVATSLMVGILRAIPSSSVSSRLGGSNSRLTVRFGDIFAENGVRVIPVNEFFDSELDEHVSKLTLHGQLISRVYGGDAKRFEADVDRLLPSAQSEVVARTAGRERKYPLGTTVLVRHNEERYLLFALARTDAATRKAYATVQDMWSAMDGLWTAARAHSNGNAIVLPLIGSGQSGVGLSPQHLLHLILLSAIAETKRQRIAKEIVVVLQEQFYADIDLSTLDQLAR